MFEIVAQRYQIKLSLHKMDHQPNDKDLAGFEFYGTPQPEDVSAVGRKHRDKYLPVWQQEVRSA